MNSSQGQINKNQEVLPTAAALAQKSVEPSSSDTKNAILPVPNMMYLIIQAMQDGSNSWLEQMKLTIGYQQEMNMTMIGGEQKKDGSWVVDSSKSFINDIITAEVDSGKDDAKSSMADCWSHVGASATNGLAAGTVAGAGVRDSMNISKINKDIADTQAFSDELTKAQAPGVAVAGNNAPAPATNPTAVINDWKAGNNLNKAGFDANAASQLKTTTGTNADDLKIVQDKIKDKISSLEQQKTSIAYKADSRSRYLQMASSTADNGNQAYWSTQRAGAQEQKGKDQAAAGAFQSVLQAANSQVDELKQNAAKYQQNAEQQIAVIGQLTPARA